MDNFYMLSSGSYSDYNVWLLFKSPAVITEEQFRKYHLEAIKRSSEFEDKQAAKLSKFLSKPIISTNYYQLNKSSEVRISYKDWEKLCKDAGVEANPHNWLKKILVENGCEIINYGEFNTDDWD